MTKGFKSVSTKRRVKGIREELSSLVSDVKSVAARKKVPVKKGSVERTLKTTYSYFGKKAERM